MRRLADNSVRYLSEVRAFMREVMVAVLQGPRLYFAPLLAAIRLARRATR
jgi:hypothetical protein